jgi:hypothetical protein
VRRERPFLAGKECHLMLGIICFSGEVVRSVQCVGVFWVLFYVTFVMCRHHTVNCRFVSNGPLTDVG